MKIPAKKVFVIFCIVLLVLIIYFVKHKDGQIRLIVRGDDMGFSHYANTLEEMISTAVKVLDNLSPGTWDFYDHPGMIIEGEELAWHIGAEGDGIYRDRVTKALISDQLQEVIKRRNIQLLGYRDLKFWH